MQRLYLQFYVAVLLVLVVFVGAAALAWKLAEDQTPQYLDVAAELTGALLPDADAPPAESQRALDALHRKLRFDLSLYRPDAAQRLLRANCSHELRTPLARISMATSLLGDGANAKTREALKRDIDELDRLIEEILLASRLEAVPGLERQESIDLLALAAEEA